MLHFDPKSHFYSWLKDEKKENVLIAKPVNDYKSVLITSDSFQGQSTAATTYDRIDYLMERQDLKEGFAKNTEETTSKR